MSPIRCIIIDDEELARKLLETYAGKVEHLEYKASFENPLEALSFLKKNDIDLIFLDIQMPELKGTDFAELILKSNTRIIFTTAYSEYALEGFELNALDYLLKPITFERFLKAISKFENKLMPSKDTTGITVKSGYDLYRLEYRDIFYIESDSEYVHYHMADGKKIMSNQSLKKLEELLPSNMFFRVHRSYIVNKTWVKALKGRDLLINEVNIPVSDSYYETVRKNMF
jgi:DNA-binding LytR/AlgR family response regulator